MSASRLASALASVELLKSADLPQFYGRAPLAAALAAVKACAHEAINDASAHAADALSGALDDLAAALPRFSAAVREEDELALSNLEAVAAPLVALGFSIDASRVCESVAHVCEHAQSLLCAVPIPAKRSAPPTPSTPKKRPAVTRAAPSAASTPSAATPTPSAASTVTSARVTRTVSAPGRVQTTFSQWLDSFGLAELEASFAAHGFNFLDAELLQTLDEREMTETLGISKLGFTRKLMLEIKKLKV